MREKTKTELSLWLSSILLILLFAGMVLISCEDDGVNLPPYVQTIRVGALLALEGSASGLGEECLEGINVAVKDANEYLEDEGLNYKVEIITEDSRSLEEIALFGLQHFRSDGIRLIIGPTRSLELDYIRSYANMNDLILISPSSVSIVYEQEDDNIYRFAPNDYKQVEAMAALLASDNIEAIIPFARADAWGDSLLSAMTREFEKLGGTVLEGVRYDTGTLDFYAHLDSLLDDYIPPAVNQYSDSTVAVYLLAGTEVLTLLNNTGHYVFNLLNWYGSAANVRYEPLATNMGIAEVAYNIGGFPCPVFGDVNSQAYEQPKHEIELRLGWEPDAYALAAYDALWVAVHTYLNLEIVNPPFDNLESSLLEIIDGYEGVTGRIDLDEVGDRIYAGFDFWKIQPTEPADEFEWVKFARFEKVEGDSTGRIVRYQ